MITFDSFPIVILLVVMTLQVEIPTNMSNSLISRNIHN